ncbi:MAG: DUF2752 domain-containing protein [Bacteroidales bacterium]|nr:DUF2752 domain-containing protein [Bacteroidales bacterium]
MNTTAKRIGYAFVAVAVLFAVFLYAAFDPGQAFFPRCPFFMATGLKCPGCGSQRAVHQLLNGNLAEAFHYNALLLAAIPILLFLALAYALRRRSPRLYAISNSSVLAWALLALILLWWILRNLLGW